MDGFWSQEGQEKFRFRALEIELSYKHCELKELPGHLGREGISMPKAKLVWQPPAWAFLDRAGEDAEHGVLHGRECKGFQKGRHNIPNSWQDSR